jgi:4-hydroxy-2-oxoheptanedioate aldolase
LLKLDLGYPREFATFKEEDDEREELLKMWRNQQPIINGWVATASSFNAEVMAHQGWDSITVDMQHGLVDYQAMVHILQAISTTSTVPMVRVPWLDPAHIMKTLDAGAYGIICPMINTVDEAANLVKWTSYAPMGVRSFGPIARFCILAKITLSMRIKRFYD